jgi:RNA polymerase sigma-70 factor, ECF subfamily
LETTETELRALMLRGNTGDNAAYHQFLKITGDLLRVFFRKRLLKMPDHVEDLVQEALLGIHNQRHTYDPSQLVTAWVYAIGRYKLVDMWRRHGIRDALNDSFDESLHDVATDDGGGGADDARRDVDVLLAQLPDKQRLPIRHVKLEGLSVQESARLTGLSESAVKVGIHRGLKALAAMMRSET